MASAYELMVALAKNDRLAFFAHINPKIWEVVGGGPLGRFSHVAAELNPQPLPPRWRSFDPQPDPPAAALGYSQLIAMATAAMAGGEGATKSFLMEIDDWCGTGWPRRWPPPPPRRGEELDIVGLQLGAAFAASQLAAAYDGGEMQEAFGAAANQLADTALGR